MNPFLLLAALFLLLFILDVVDRRLSRLEFLAMMPVLLQPGA